MLRRQTENGGDLRGLDGVDDGIRPPRLVERHVLSMVAAVGISDRDTFRIGNGTREETFETRGHA